MEDIIRFFQSMGFMNMTWQQGLMIVLSFFLLYLAIKKQYEPLLLLPIAFGMLLTNLPEAGMYNNDLWTLFLQEKMWVNPLADSNEGMLKLFQEGNAMLIDPIQGIQNGWIDSRIYGPAARKAWISLCGMLDEDGNMPAVCQGTGAKDDRDWYLNRKRVNGDPHGQAPMLWICNALIKADRH